MPDKGWIRIEFYFSTLDRDGKEVPESKIDELIDVISKHYKGSTRLEGRGFYRKESGEDERSMTYCLTVITQLVRPNDDLKDFKEKIKREHNQEAVLITYNDVTPVR